MNREYYLAFIENQNPKLIKQLNLGDFWIKRRFGKIILESNTLFRLEEESIKFLEKGYEVIRPCYITFFKSHYAIELSGKPNPNSSYLKFKRSSKKLKDAFEKQKGTNGGKHD